MVVYFKYQDFTLEEIDTYTNTDFECNGDKKEIKVTIHKKEEEKNNE